MEILPNQNSVVAVYNLYITFVHTLILMYLRVRTMKSQRASQAEFRFTTFATKDILSTYHA